MSAPVLWIIPEGTSLFHGTSADERFEEDDLFEGPGWVSDDIRVARKFVGWPTVSSRIIAFYTTRDIELIEWCSKNDIEAFVESQRYELDDASSSYELAEIVASAGYEGWIIPNNYPEGVDIMLCDPASVLELDRVEKP